MFIKKSYTLTDYPYLYEPIKDVSVFERLYYPEFFDRIGYELTYIESLYHKANGIDTLVLVPGSTTDASANIQDWFEQSKPHPNIFLDHAHVLVRYSYVGNAYNQIKKYSEKYPRLRKLLNIKPKLGYDFCIDYIDNEKVFEISHFEHDFTDWKTFKKNFEWMENFILTSDWEKHSEYLKQTYKEWYTNDEYAQAQFKAKYFGIDTNPDLNEPKMLSYIKVL
jgi:hypothetical protein